MTPPAAGRRLKHPNRTWVRPFREGAGPLYLQIAQQVREAVDDGVLRPGDRLPPQRDLAQQVGVDLTTVTRPSPSCARPACWMRRAPAAPSSRCRPATAAPRWT
jgi:hypothetical protein